MAVIMVTLWILVIQGLLVASLRTHRLTSTALRMVSQHQPPFHSSATDPGSVGMPVDFRSSYALDYRPVIVGIAGGSASGKTTLARAIINNLGEEHISFVGHDNYYKNLCHLSLEERAKVNFDHPDSLDTPLLIEHIRALREGKQVHIPTYDFNTHSRTSSYDLVQPRKIIIVDGILIFSEPELLQLMDMKIFVDTADDIRLIRRISRDTLERGRTVDSVIDQYLRTVRPMHDLYVEPSKRRADIILPAGDGIAPAALEMCVSRLREIINFYQ